MAVVTHESRDIAKPSPWPNVTIRSRARTGPDLRKVAALRALEEKGSCKSCMVKDPKDCTKLSGNLISRHDDANPALNLVSWPTVASSKRTGRAKKTPRMRTSRGRQPPQARARWGSLEERGRDQHKERVFLLKVKLTTSTARSSCSCRQAWQKGSRI